MKRARCIHVSQQQHEFSIPEQTRRVAQASEFRSRLVGGGLGLLLLDALLERAQTLGLLKQRGRQRTNSTHVLAAVRSMNHLERVGETLRAALNALAAPEWLRAVAEPDWFARYGSRVENYNLPKTEAGRKQLGTLICLDGRKLLDEIGKADARLGLGALPAVLMLQRVWEEQFIYSGDGQPVLRDVAKCLRRQS